MRFLLIALAIFSFKMTFAAEYTRTLEPIGNQADCGAIDIHTKGVLENHPIIGLPKSISVSGADIFKFQEWYRSWDSIVTLYMSRDGEKLYLDDACYDDGKLLLCLQYNSCFYYY